MERKSAISNDAFSYTITQVPSLILLSILLFLSTLPYTLSSWRSSEEAVQKPFCKHNHYGHLNYNHKHQFIQIASVSPEH